MPLTIRSFLEIVFTLFLVTNTLTCASYVSEALKGFNQRERKKIIAREGFIALIILSSFACIGPIILDFLGINLTVLLLSGGIVLLLRSLKMIFPQMNHISENCSVLLNQGRFPVGIPLAIPFIASPGAIITLLVYQFQFHLDIMQSLLSVIAAVLTSVLIFFSCAYVKKKIGEKGLTALERLSGLLVMLIGLEMLLNGIREIIASLQH